MSNKSKLKFVLAWCLGLPVFLVFGYDVPVHEAITLNAQLIAYYHSSGYLGFINTVSNSVAISDTTNSMTIGSGVEDNQVPPVDEGGYRSLNHFYDPLDTTYGKRLSDSIGFSDAEALGDKRVLVGTNSFAWASISNCVGVNFAGVTFIGAAANINTRNTWSWPYARYYEWRGLTASNQGARQTNLLAMFRSVGQVMHLLEDASQPQHVRNEQHFDPFDP